MSTPSYTLLNVSLKSERGLDPGVVKDIVVAIETMIRRDYRKSGVARVYAAEDHGAR